MLALGLKSLFQRQKLVFTILWKEQNSNNLELSHYSLHSTYSNAIKEIELNSNIVQYKPIFIPSFIVQKELESYKLYMMVKLIGTLQLPIDQVKFL
jgi:hypothetical protein